MHPNLDQSTAPSEGPLPRRNEPAASEHHYLLRVYPRAELEGLIELRANPFLIGRDSACHLRLESPSASRRHAAIEQHGELCVLVDLNSTNGLYVNDTRVGGKLLQAGDRIRVGGHVLKFLMAGDVESQYHQAMHQLSVTDGLTGVYNKRYLLESLNWELARQAEASVSLILLDLDGLKQINDQRGHLAGDAVLQEWARRCQGTLRQSDFLARYGGEEFAVVLRHTKLDRALRVAELLLAVTRSAPMATPAGRLLVTASGGTASSSEPGLSPCSADQLLAAADRRLYQAKANGRDRVLADDPAGDSAARSGRP